MPAYRKLPSCEGCTLLTQPGPVFGEGNPVTAKLIYVAQNPGQEEIAASPMRPLIGPSGRVFNRQCAEAGLSRDDIYVSNQVKCLTPGNREPTQLEIDKCKPILESEMSRCRADIVVLSGGVTFKANIGRYSTLRGDYRPSESIFERAGCVEQRDGRKWIGTLHPAFLIRTPDMRELGPAHLKKAASLAGVALPLPNIRTHVTDEEVLAFVDQTILGSREFADDVETVGLSKVDEDDYVGGDWLMTMCGVANSPWEALVLTPRQVPLLQPIFIDKEIWRYEHNGEYDNYYLEKFIPPEIMENRKFDTMQGTHWLRSHAPKKLKPFCLSTYTWLPYYNRDLGKLDERFYNGMDLVATFQAAKEQRRQIKNEQLEEIFFSLGMPILPILEEWRRIGLRVDIRKALLFKMVIEEKMKRAACLVTKLVGPTFSPSNHYQLKTLLYDTYKLPPQYTKEKKITSGYDARKTLRLLIESKPEYMERWKVAHTLIILLDFLSGEKKKLEYIGRISPDERIHPNFKAHGQRVFRLGSTPSVVNIPVYDISAWGGARRDDNNETENPIEKEDERSLAPARGQPSLGSLRSMVIPDRPEDWILTCDFEQMQLLILAAQFKVKWLLDIFERGEYLYGIVYEKLYNEPFFQAGLPRTKKNRLVGISESRIKRAKGVPLGFVFNRSGEAVAKEFGWTPQEGREYRRWFMTNCGELEPAYSKVEFQVNQKHMYRHIFGQIMHFPDGKVNVAINSLAQSNEAMIVRESIIMIDREFKRRGWKPQTRTMLSVHDSLSSNVNGRNPSHMVEVYEEVVKPILDRPIPQLGGFRFRHSAEVSKMWDWDVMSYPEWKGMAACG